MITREQRATLLRQRFAVLNPAKPVSITPRRSKVVRQEPTHRDYYSYGVAMSLRQPDWVKQATKRPKLVLTCEKKKNTISALTQVARKMYEYNRMIWTQLPTTLKRKCDS